MRILRHGKDRRVAEATDSGRRSFIWRLGAGASAAVASTAGMGRPAQAGVGNPALQAALLAEEKTLRQLHKTFEQALEAGRHVDVIALFADDAQVVFNGGVFSRRDAGVTRLYRDRFPAGRTGRMMAPPPGFASAAVQLPDGVAVSADLLTATAQFPYSIQVGRPIDTEGSLAAMARLHGEGVQTWWEGGVYRVTYRREAVTARWQISRLEYDTQSRADYRPGRSYAQAIAVAPLTQRFPQDRQGPDELV